MFLALFSLLFFCFVEMSCSFYFLVSAFFYKPFFKIDSKVTMSSRWKFMFVLSGSKAIQCDLFLKRSVFTLCSTKFSIMFTYTFSIKKHSPMGWKFFKVFSIILFSFCKIFYLSVSPSDIIFYVLKKF